MNRLPITLALILLAPTVHAMDPGTILATASLRKIINNSSHTFELSVPGLANAVSVAGGEQTPNIPFSLQAQYAWIARLCGADAAWNVKIYALKIKCGQITVNNQISKADAPTAPLESLFSQVVAHTQNRRPVLEFDLVIPPDLGKMKINTLKCTKSQ